MGYRLIDIINEEVKRMRVLMGLNENIQHNNFAQMGLTRKTISRGGVMYQEQDMVSGVEHNRCNQNLSLITIEV